MIKVIRPGKPWTLNVTCTGQGNGGKGCLAELLVDRNDLEYYEGTDYPIYRDPAVVVRCPDCGQLTDLKEHDYPLDHTSLKPFEGGRKLK